VCMIYVREKIDPGCAGILPTSSRDNLTPEA
jgi:hypothetical protein